ncbi:MAG: M48 family metallopeptidase [Anaerolineae bacterium]|jgi:STE24 endopeptidase|nr:M48 family metallopeptidase [Anaerolineae bacterium]MCZ7553187.1 M48 family metallopeptidase [Anaerolineales bacterium]
MDLPETDLTLDPARQEKARELARIQRRLMLVDLGLGGVYLLVWLLSGASLALRGWLANLTANAWLQVAGFAIVFGGIYVLLDLPLAYYEGFALPHRYDLSTQTLRGWVADRLKMGLIGGVLGLVMLEVIYAVLRAFPSAWWLWAAGLLLLFNVVLANLAPVLLFPIFYKFSPLGEQHHELEQRLLALAQKAGTRVRGVYRFDMSRRTRAANAALTGLGNTRRIILGDTLLDEFSLDEIETVLAHELGHHVHRDIPLGMLIGAVSMLLGFYLVALVLNWGVNAFGFAGVYDIAALPLFGLTLGAFGLISMPFNNAYSRWRERMADRYALETTRKPQAFAGAMTRLANQNLADADPEPWVEWLLYSHPALSRRIQMAEDFETAASAP